MLVRMLCVAACLALTLVEREICAAESASSSSMVRFLQLAAASHPEIGRAKALYEVELAEIDRAGAWPDPVLSLGIGVEPVETALGARR